MAAITSSNHVFSRYFPLTLLSKTLFTTTLFTTAWLSGVMPSLAANAQDDLLVYAPTTESTATNELSRYGSKLEVITRSQIEQAGVNADITRVLQMFVPGLYVSPKAGPFDYGHYSLLGGKNDDTLILIDGVRLNNRLYGGVYIDTLPVTAVERIEVLKGPQSLMFGTQAVAGVINIVTKIPHGKKLVAEVNVAVDSFAGTDIDASIGDVHDNALGNFSWLVWADNNRSAGYQPFRDSDIEDLVTQRKRSYNVTVLGSKLSQTFADKARLTLLWQYAQGKFDFASAGRYRINKTTGSIIRRGSIIDRNDRVQNIGTITFDHYLTDNFSYFIKGHVNLWDTYYIQKVNDDTNGIRTVKMLSDNNYWGFHDYGLQLEGKLNFVNASELIFGVDNQWFSGQDEQLLIAKNTATTNALYLQLRPQFSRVPDWHPAVGVRHEKIHGGAAATVWSVSSSYDITPELQLRGQIGTAFKLPTAEQLYAIESDDIGNPNLKPEQSRNIEAGFDYQPNILNGGLKLSASYYNRNIYDMKTTDSTGFWINVPGEVEVQGFELNGSLAINKQYRLSADVTRNYLNSKYVISNVPYLFSRVRLDYSSIEQRWGGQLAARYIDKVISSGIDYGHYAVLDASLWLHLDQARQHKLSLLVDNLLNQKYASSITKNSRGQYIDTLGRPLTAELRYSWTF